MLKLIPNILTFARFALCIPLFILDPARPWWIALFMIAGFTDIFDGPLARKIPGAASKLGESIDSTADMFLVVTGFVRYAPRIFWETDSLGQLVKCAENGYNIHWMYWVFTAALSYKITSAIFGYIWNKQPISLHTIANKFLAFFVFMMPIVHWFSKNNGTFENLSTGVSIYMYFATFIVFIITTEEYLINIFLKKPNLNIKSIFHVKAENEKYYKEQGGR